MHIIITIVLSYIIGAIPFSFIIGKMNGVNVLKEGSCNPGASNVLRTAGKSAGILAYISDIGKGIISVSLINIIFGDMPNLSYLLIISGASAMLGHIYSVFLAFKGGKGVATACGVMFILAPISLLASLIFFFIGLLASKKMVAVGSTVAAVSFPIMLTVFRFFCYPLYKLFYNVEYVYLMPAASILMILIIIKHIPNYKRMIEGKEHGFQKK